MSVAIGIDVGGTKIAGGLITSAGDIVHEQRVATPRADRGADPGARATLALFRDLLAQARSAGLEVVAGGVGVPEYVTPEGTIASAEVLAWGDELNDLTTTIPVVIESDVRCGALGELRCGHGRDVSSMAYVSIGTGISSTIAVDGRLWPGHRGEALALGELPVARQSALIDDEPLTLECQASGRALEICRQRSLDAATTFDADTTASQAGVLTAGAVATIVRLIDPEVVVLGGGIGSAQGPYAESLIAHAALLLASRPGAPSIRRSHVGTNAGLIGAGLAAHEHFDATQTRGDR